MVSSQLAPILSEEQLSRIGIRTMGQRVRMMNAAQAMISVGQNVNENIVEEPEEDDDLWFLNMYAFQMF